MLKIKISQQINRSYCGPATAQMLLSFWGFKESQKNLAQLCRTTILKGTDKDDLAKCLKKFNLKLEYGANGNWSKLNKFINEKKVPVIVRWFYEDWGHYSLVLGLTKKSIWLAEPYGGQILKMNWSIFNQVWFGFDRKFPEQKNITANWYLAVLGRI